jgi:hypothetical protein
MFGIEKHSYNEVACCAEYGPYQCLQLSLDIFLDEGGSLRKWKGPGSVRCDQFSNIIFTFAVQFMSRSSAVGIVTGYGLDYRRRDRDRVPVWSRMFTLNSVHTGSGAHPASYPKGTGGSFPGGKATGA